MNVLIPVAAYHEYNTAVYVEAALRQLGHEARVITQAEFYEDHPDADLFFGVDSAGPLDFPEKHLPRTAMWFIDSRHNNDPGRRQPDDDTNARRITDGGGWVFQAQKQDWLRNVQQGVLNSNWLPLAADPDIWKPVAMPKIYDVGFGGNVWCKERQAALERIGDKWQLGRFVGRPADLVEGYARSKVGFNISGWYGSAIAYDINMRVFEVLACGLPLVTNYLPELMELGILPEDTCLPYHSLDGAMAQIRLALQRGEAYRADLGRRARHLILDGHTYRHRMEEALEILTEAEMTS
jgi:hypothetical protein